MKRQAMILLSAALLFGGAGMSARQRTRLQMEQTATSAIAAMQPEALSRGERAALVELSARDQLSVLGYENGPFAVVTADDRFPALLGVGERSTGSNPDFDWYLDAANAALQQARARGTVLRRVAPDTSRFPAEVPNLLTTRWSQDEPYKNHTPLMANGDNYVTGCVATSMAQVLAYHRLPIYGTGEATVTSPLGEKLTARFGETLYDWDRMKPSYNYVQKDYTFEEGEAVAVLMAHCGVAADMTYNEAGSGTNYDVAAEGMRRYFGFKNTRHVRRSSYADDTQWMNLIFDELSHASPVMYGGQSTYGHSFVFAGYRADGLVYVNWGWGGDKNGWYDVNVLDPDNNGGFVTNQSMLIGVRSYQPDVRSITVSMTEAGTLASQLNASTTYGEIKIVGPINGTDLKLLRERVSSARDDSYPNAADTYRLDLSEARFVKGGDVFLTVGSKKYSVDQDDEVPAMAFNGLANLRYLSLPATATNVGAGALGGCMALTAIDGTGDGFVFEDNILYNADKTKVLAVMADAMGELVIPEGVAEIGDYAFASLTAVTKIDLPSTLTAIGSSVFASGGSLKELWMRAGSRPKLADRNVFSPIVGTVLLYVHAANKRVYQASPYTAFTGTRLFGTVITATSTTREVGQENPPFGYSVEGESVQGEPLLVCDATPDSPAGVYPIYCQAGTVVGSDVTFVDGRLIVTESTGIAQLSADGRPFDVYTPDGLLVRRAATTLDGLPKGVYVAGGNKVVIK